MISKLIKRIQETNAPICVGLDPMPDLIPASVLNSNYEIYGKNLRAVAESFCEFNKKIIDADISSGCFSKEINFNTSKRINNKNIKYKEGKIHPEKFELQNMPKLEDIPYYAFSISSKEDLKNKLIILIEEIFKEY